MCLLGVYLILDLALPGLNGLDLQKQVAIDRPEMPIITEALQREGFLIRGPHRSFAITIHGRKWFEQRGVSLPSAGAPNRKLVRRCPDLTERRPHIAGILGVAMLKRFSDLEWIVPIRKSRAVRVTLEGRKAFAKYRNNVEGLHLKLRISQMRTSLSDSPASRN